MHEKVREIVIEMLKGKLPDQLVEEIPREELSDEDLVMLWRIVLIGAIDTAIALLLGSLLGGVKVNIKEESEEGISIDDILKKINEEEEGEERFL